MFGELDLDRVDELRIKVAYTSQPEAPSHEVFLLDVRIPEPGTFDEQGCLEDLEPIVAARGQSPHSCIVRRMRTHKSGSGRDGEAEISVIVTTGDVHAVDGSTTEAVTTAFRDILQRVKAADASSLDHDAAIVEARTRVAKAYPEVSAASLAVTDEEHLAHARMWSVGMAQGTATRYQVMLGFVHGVRGTAHVRRMPAGEVVDSVGSD